MEGWCPRPRRAERSRCPRRDRSCLPVFNRPVSSWYFGDGSFQVDQFPNVRQSGILAPLDGALQSRMVTRETGRVFGLREARRISSRVAAELNVDYARGRWRSPAMQRRRWRPPIQLHPAFNGLFISPLIASRTVNSSLALTDNEGS